MGHWKAILILCLALYSVRTVLTLDATTTYEYDDLITNRAQGTRLHQELTGPRMEFHSVASPMIQPDPPLQPATTQVNAPFSHLPQVPLSKKLPLLFSIIPLLCHTRNPRLRRLGYLSPVDRHTTSYDAVKSRSSGAYSRSTATTYTDPAIANGNISEYIDLANGNITAHLEYDAFGRIIASTETAPAPFGFSTKYLDDKSGYYYYGFRYYDPEAGRWLNRDPIQERGGYNLYGFVGNNVVNLLDYLGFTDLPGSTSKPILIKPRGSLTENDFSGTFSTITGKKLNHPLEHHGYTMSEVQCRRFNEGWIVILDRTQDGIDVLGMIPLFGEVADGVNAVIYMSRGDALNAGISMAAMIPVGGQVATGGRLAVKYSPDVIKSGQRVGKEIQEHILESGAKRLDDLPPPNKEIFRGMKESAEELPQVGPSARELGARPGIGPGKDIPVENGMVKPGTGGMSVAPDTPANLPSHRRPPSHGGVGKDPVWKLNTEQLGSNLRYIQDSPTHGLIEPAQEMTADDFQKALKDTVEYWTRQ